jgi:hypothetical protein
VSIFMGMSFEPRTRELSVDKGRSKLGASPDGAVLGDMNRAAPLLEERLTLRLANGF